MRTDSDDGLWLDQSGSVSLAELAGLARLTESEVCELVDIGILAPADPQADAWIFSAHCVATLRCAIRLRDELELDWHAVAVALSLIEQISRLEGDLASLRARLPQQRDR